MTALLEVTGISKRFGGLQAVHDLSLTVRDGEILGLIGPNGAGKSTVFNLINGVYPPDKGRIAFKGRDITGEPPYRIARRGLARTHQIVQPLMGMTVLENCTVGACFGREHLPLGPAREVVREVAEIVGLADRLDHLAGQLTTAGKKRLELARALSARPDLDATRGRTDAAEFLEAGEVDDRFRLLDLFLEPDEAVVAASELPGAGTHCVQECKRVAQIARLIKSETGHHVLDLHARLAHTQFT